MKRTLTNLFLFDKDPMNVKYTGRALDLHCGNVDRILTYDAALKASRERAYDAALLDVDRDDFTNLEGSRAYAIMKNLRAKSPETVVVGWLRSTPSEAIYKKIEEDFDAVIEKAAGETVTTLLGILRAKEFDIQESL